jgi:hypothetical protein
MSQTSILNQSRAATAFLAIFAIFVWRARAVHFLRIFQNASSTSVGGGHEKSWKLKRRAQGIFKP